MNTFWNCHTAAALFLILSAPVYGQVVQAPAPLPVQVPTLVPTQGTAQAPAQAPAQPPNCALCAAGSAEIAKSVVEEQTYAKLLANNQAMLKGINPDDISKKIKLTSNLLILSSKIETLANNRTVKQMDLDKKGCATCPTNQ